MANDVYLHIGAPKTGTSYLQLMLWRNRQQVENSGVTLLLGKRQHQFDAVADMRGGVWSRAGVSKTWADLVAAAHAAEGTSLVSEELLCATPEEKLPWLIESLRPLKVHVVLAARDIGRQVPAEWQQAVRGRSPVPYSDWLDTIRDDPNHAFWASQDPTRVLGRWTPHLPLEQIHVITVPAKGADVEELWLRFSSLLGLPATGLDTQLDNQNPSLGMVEAEILRRVNARLGPNLPMREPYQRVVRDHLLRPVLLHDRESIRLGVPAEHVGWINARSVEIAQAVRDLGVHVIGDVDELVSDVKPSARHPGDLSDSELLEASLDSIVGMLLHLERLHVESVQRRAQNPAQNPARNRRTAQLAAEVKRLRGRTLRGRLRAVRQRLRG